MAESFDAVVIGAGVIGAAVGLELARKGLRTLNIDMGPSPGYGSTSNSSSIIRTHYSTLEGAAFAHEGYFYWKDWAAHVGLDEGTPLAEFRETGAVIMKTEGNGGLQSLLGHQRTLGIPFEEWNGAELRRRLPYLDFRLYYPPKRLEDESFGEPTGGELEGAVFFPRAGYVNDPQLAARNLATAAERAGGRFLFRKRVTAIDKDRAGRVAGVTLGDGSRIASRIVVNVAGPHSSKANALAGADADMAITTRALKQEVAHLPGPIEAYTRTGYVTADSDIAVYTRPDTGDLILIGTEDPPGDHREWVDADDWNESFTDQVQLQVMRAAQRFATLRIPGTIRGVTALYDVTEDWIPIYDKSCVPGFYMAVGTSGNQFKNAPVAGLLMAHLIEAVENGHDHDSDPVRLPLKYTGWTTDAGFYSRRRQINAESSFSVLG